MPNLSDLDFQRISQLSNEMKHFPPEYFTNENILSWSKYFNIAPENLEEYTSRTGRILRLAERLAKKTQGLEVTEETPEEKEETKNEIRSISPIPPPESLDFLWLQTQLILAPQSDSTVLEEEFSTYFKLAAYIKNTENTINDLKSFCDHYDNPGRECNLYNASITLLEELNQAASEKDLEKSKTIYRKIYTLNLSGLEPSEVAGILKSAPQNLKDQFLLSEDNSTQITASDNDSDSTDPLAFGQSIRTKISKIAEDFSEQDLSIFKNLDIKFDETQKAAFTSQVKNLLLKISTKPSAETISAGAGHFSVPADLMKGAYLPDMLNKKETTAAAYAMGLAELFYAKGMTRKELKILFENLQSIGAIGSKVSLPKILSSLGSNSLESTDANRIISTIAPVSLAKFEENNRPLTQSKQALISPKVSEAQKNGVYRTQLMFYVITAGARGPQLETRRPVVKSWFDSILRSFFGNNPPDQTDREIARLNKLKGWSTRENVYPPPFTDLEKKFAIQLLKEHLLKQGIDLPDDSLLAENAVAFYFNQSAALTYSHFEELYKGIMTIRLKLESALSNPERDFDLTPQELKNLSTYMNISLGEVENIVEEFKKTRTSEDQQKRLFGIQNHLVVLEWAHESLAIAYNNANTPKARELQAAQASIEATVELAEKVREGGYTVEYGSTLIAPQATAAAAPSSATPVNAE